MRRNIVFLSMAFLSLACLIVACLGFGFQPAAGVPASSADPATPTATIIDLDDLRRAIIDTTLPKTAAAYLKNCYGLIVSGLALTTIAVLMGTMQTYFQPTKTRLVKGIAMWDQIFITFLVYASVALVLTGEMLFMNKYYDQNGAGKGFANYWKVGIMVGQIIFSVIPLFLMIAPFFIKSSETRMRKVSHSASKEHKTHHHKHQTTTTRRRTRRQPHNLEETETLIIA